MTLSIPNRALRTAILTLLGLAGAVSLFPTADIEAQSLERLSEAFVDMPPVWFRLQAPESGSRVGTRVPDDRSWVSWLTLRETAQRLEIGEFGTADFAMSELMEYHRGTLSIAAALMNRGTMALERREYGRARYYFSEAITEASQENTSDAEDLAGTALYSIALAHAIERDQPVEKTIEIVEDFLEHYPGNPRERDGLDLLGELTELRGDFAAAASVYDKIIDNYPTVDQLHARNRKGHCMLEMARFSDAREQLQGVADVIQRGDAVDTTDARVITARAENNLLRGELEILTKNYAAAEAAFLPLVADPKSRYRRSALLGLGATYQAAGHLDSALALYDQLVTGDTIDIVRMKAEFNRAMALRGLGRGDEAAATFGTIAGNRAHAMADRAFIELGIAAYERRAYAEADSSLIYAAANAHSGSTRVRALTLLGAVKLAENDPDMAIKAFEAADGITTGNAPGQGGEEADARLLRGLTLARVNRSAEAITVLNRFIDEFPTHPGIDQAEFWLAESYFQSGLYKAAADAATTLLEQHPASSATPDALYLLGWAQLKARNFAKAEAAFSQLAKAYPVSAYAAEAQLRRGDALYLAGRFDEAVDAYHGALAQKPTSDELAYAEYQTALAEIGRGRLSAADSLLQAFATCHAGNELRNDARYLRGDIALRDGRAADAVSLMNTFLAGANRSELTARGFKLIGDAYERLGNREMSTAAYSIVVNRWPTSQAAKAARERLEKFDDGEAGDEHEAVCGPITRAAMARADILSAAGRPSEAIGEYNAINRDRLADECLAQLWLHAAHTRMAAGDTAGALDTLRLVGERFAKTGPGYSATLDLGIALDRSRRAPEAAELLETLRAGLTDSSDHSSLLIALADAYAHAGNGDTARALLMLVTDRTPASPLADAAWIRRARLETDPTLRSAALARLETISRRNDSVGLDAARTSAVLAESGGDYRKAAAIYEGVLPRLGGDYQLRAQMLIDLGEAYEHAGDAEHASQAYRKILQQVCDGELSRKAQEHLEHVGSQ